ncbi:MAG TPA: hypothetical protein PJ982_14525 [Lacipirellulaceae bacterium]|nr:hypothetical protein [Lacipirellulaceae bacterium]
MIAATPRIAQLMESNHSECRQKYTWFAGELLRSLREGDASAGLSSKLCGAAPDQVLRVDIVFILQHLDDGDTLVNQVTIQFVVLFVEKSIAILNCRSVDFRRLSSTKWLRDAKFDLAVLIDVILIFASCHWYFFLITSYFRSTIAGSGRFHLLALSFRAKGVFKTWLARFFFLPAFASVKLAAADAAAIYYSFH